MGRQSSEVWSGGEVWKDSKSHIFTFHLSVHSTETFSLFTVSHGFLPNSNRSLICASKNTDAPFGAELSLYMRPREAILALPPELINSLLDQEKRLDAAMCIVCLLCTQTMLTVKDLRIVFNLPVKHFTTKGTKYYREVLRNTLLSCSQQPFLHIIKHSFSPKKCDIFALFPHTKMWHNKI